MTAASRATAASNSDAVASGGFALVAEQGARLLRGQLAHLLGLDDRLGQLELAGVDPLQILLPAARAAERPSAGVPSAFRWT